jgi:hypothetical protein
MNGSACTRLRSYRTLSDAALIDERKDLGEDDIQVKIDGHEVTNARLIMMQIMNIGSQPIKNDEYDYNNESKIRFEFPPLTSKDKLKDAQQITQSLQTKKLDPLQPSLLILCALHDTKPESIMSKEQQKKQLRLGNFSTKPSPLYDYVDLMGTLMNPGDYINLKFMTQGYAAKLFESTFLGRIEYTKREPIKPLAMAWSALF